MEVEEKSKIDRRLARIEGQIRGIRKMLDEGQYCMDVLSQISAARSALNRAGAELVTSHVKSCVIGHQSSLAHAKSAGMTTEELIEELRANISRLL